MKFLCENCKAKYQIGDEKVAGKTVRMKCRRCGHLITVSAKVTESSVAHHADAGETPALGMDAAPESGPGLIPPAPAALAFPPRNDGEEEESTTIMSSPFRPPTPAATRAPAPAPAAGRPAPPAPRPQGIGLPGGVPRAAPAAPRPITALRTAGPAQAAAPARDLRPAPNPSHQAAPAQVVAPQPVAPIAPAPSPRGVSQQPDSGGVAAAFQRAVSDPKAPSARPPHDDWYVGVNGTPLGPVRIDLIREKATLGLVDGDSLVWREGFDEWQPLKRFPELIEVVQAAQLLRTGRASPAHDPQSAGAFAPAPGAVAGGAQAAGSVYSIAAALSPQVASPFTRGQPAPHAEPAQAVAPAPSHAAPAPAPAPAAGQGYVPTPLGLGEVSVLADPFAAPAPIKPDAPIAPIAEAKREAAAAWPVAPSPAKVGDAGPSSADLEALIPQRRSGAHPMVYAFVAMAAVFGGVAAYFLFYKPVQTQIVVVEKAVPAPGSTAAAAASPTGEQTAEATAETAAPVAVKGPLGVLRPKASATTAPVSAPGAPIDTSGFSSGVQGPTASGPAGNGASAGGGQLTQTEISGVVSQNQARVRRQCWEPALAGKAPNTPPNARVNATLTIGASGSVESVNASGADAYPGLASCVAGKMRNWNFPKSGGSTTVNVPFVFAGQ